MNTSQLSSYAPAARQAFIAAVSTQATRLGVTAGGIADAQQQGDVLLIGGQAFPKSIADAREKLAERVRSHGFVAAMDAAAYTWFNRFAAIRYMELHGYLDHGYRVLSHPDAAESQPEILDHAADIDLPSLDQQKAIELKLDGTKDEELYRLLLLAQCNALHTSMPFLFEEIGASDELLLPANLLHTDSLVRGLVEGIDQEAWEHIEIIGWLYQFYISEKKDQVIGKVVKSEDIPAATQLFTPNWIVKYMVQNSLGAQWMATYPQSPLKGQMEYYIEPAEQTDEVNAQLAAIIPTSLNPEELTLIDPASGSGHILVEAYDLFKAIYLERGYRQRDVPQLILEKNLYGLDIDERAAQLTGFALMMKGRADDRRLFEREVKLNVVALQNSTDFDADGLASSIDLADYNLTPLDIRELKDLFAHATTFGSLIQVPEELANKLPALKKLSESTNQDLFVSASLKRLGPLVQQAGLLAAQYDAVVANPPYIGTKFHVPELKKFLKSQYKGFEKDVFSAFIDRSLTISKSTGRIGIVAPYVWMFISSFDHLRGKLISETNLTSLIQLEYNAFEPAMIPVATFTLTRQHVAGFTGSYIKLSDFKGHQNQAPKTLEAIHDRNCGWFHLAKADEFKAIPGSPIAYWLSAAAISSYSKGQSLGQVVYGQPGLQTSNNNMFVRLWAEVPLDTIGIGFANSQDAEASALKWFPYLKGGGYRKWYGNQNHVVNWRNNGEEIKSYVNKKYPYLNGNIDYVVKDRGYYFKKLITYTTITSGNFSARAAESGFVFDVAGSSVFPTNEEYFLVAGFLCSKIANMFVRAQNPTLNIQSGDIGNLPILTSELKPQAQVIDDILTALFELSKHDWDTYERSWDFQSLPILTASTDSTPTLESSYTAWISLNRVTIAEMKRLEEENNRLFIDAYELADELTPDVPIEQITLTVNPAYRYSGKGGKLTEAEQWPRFRQDSMEELVSYAIGCMMGRYSLDAPGLIYAHSGNEGFDSNRYSTFPADDDGIVPLTDTEWFEDDACNRAVEFVSAAWPKEQLEDNLTFLADNLSPKKGESSRDTLRRYLCTSFFKKHTQTYKKRPIYWLFTSGRQKAFQCLVYLHRYNEGTLARMRSEYVIPLQGKMATRLEQLTGDIASATSTAQAKRLTKEKEKLEKQRVELISFDEKLRHYADMRIDLDLDDGVKVNYGKFGDLLAKV